jgi:hypothetical protein
VSVTSTSVAAAREAGRTLDGLLERPRTVVAALAGAQVLAIVVLASSIQHNGWAYFHGGDQIWIATQGWLLGHLELPPTEIGYFWSLVLTPIMRVTGPAYVQAVPPVLALNVFVLGPIALFCVYGIAAQIGGRLLGYWASFLWVIAPFAAIPLFVDRYQERWTEHFLPQALGLTTHSDFPSMVAVLVAAFFIVRSLDTGSIATARLADAAMAGILLGAAAGMKPPNMLLGVGAALAYLVARRWREAVAFGVAVLPAVLVIALWKERGLGRIPAFGLEETQLVAGSTVAVLNLDLDHYLELDVDHWRLQMDYLREFFFSARVAQWAPFAGLLAVLRVRRFPIAALLAGWLGAFLLVKGFSTRADIQANTFWRLLMPAWPAYLVLFASIPLLVPTLARRLGDRIRPPETRPIAGRWVALAAVLALAVPAVAIAASSPLEDGSRAVFQDDVDNFILTPVDSSVELRAERTAQGQRLTWTPGSWRANVFYRVYRTNEPGPDVECDPRAGAAYCFVRAVPIHTTRETEFVDPNGAPGLTYRIGVGTNWLDDDTQGDVFAFSRPVTVP